MNSSILVSGFVVVGVGTMAVLFGPSYSTDEDQTEISVAFRQNEDQQQQPVVSSKTDEQNVDAEPFAWEEPAKPAVGSKMAKELTVSAPVKKESRPIGLAAASKKKQQLETEKRAVADFLTEAAPADVSLKTPAPKSSTVENDLSSFFGSTAKPAKLTKPTKSTATNTAAPKTQLTTPPKATTARKASPKVQSEPVRVAKLPKTLKKNNSDQLAIVRPPVDDAPMFAPLASPQEMDDSPKLATLSKAAEKKTAPAKQPKSTSVDTKNTASKKSARSNVITGDLQSDESMKPAMEKIKITNPAETGLTVNLLVNGKLITLKPKQSYVIRDSAGVNVKFSRGGSFGVAVKSLDSGHYHFSVSREKGWNLNE